MRIAIGCDEAAYQLKTVIKMHLKEKGLTVEDFGTYTPEEQVLYPDIAVKVAESIADGRQERGILLCGTGLGMAIAANKVPGIRACTCHDPYSVERSRKSNNAQIITMGARVIGPELAKKLIDIWLECEFSGGSSEKKVERIQWYEEQFCKESYREEGV